MITGDSLGQVASQTVENINTVSGAVPGVQIFRPLIGMDKMEIIETAQEDRHIRHLDAQVPGLLRSVRAPFSRDSGY